MRAIAWGLAALLVPAGVAACGGGGGSTLSAEEFRKQGNAVCRDGDAELVEAGKVLLSEIGQEQLSVERTAQFFADKAIPIARKKLDRLEELDAPKADRDKLKDLVTAGRDAADKVEEGLRKDGPAFLAAEGPDPFVDFDKKANDLGLGACAGKKAEK